MKTNVIAKEVIKNLEKIQNCINLSYCNFLRESLIWIRDRANYYLDQRTGDFKGTTNVAKSWEINVIDNNHYELRNTNINGAYVEFGVGLVGKENPHKKAKDENYEYDVNNHGKKGWTWTNEEIGVTMYGFEGYKGKSFLYDAFFDYKRNLVYKEIFYSIFKKILN